VRRAFSLLIGTLVNLAEWAHQVRRKSSTHLVRIPSMTLSFTGDRTAVVDTHFRVFGARSLRVIDSSSLPVLTNGHPMAVLIMMAERAVEFLVNDSSSDD
jgi:choline dehydrogenase-like flavoprotein